MSKRYVFLNEGRRLTLRKVHTSNLFDLLQLSLRERNYCRANRIVEILLQCPEANIALIWQAAVDVLSHLNSSTKVCLEFFNKLLVYTKCQNSEILLELIFFQMKSGNSVEALETLETYLPQMPFCDNPLFHGYAGLLAYAMWDHSNVVIDAPRSSSSEQEDEHLLSDDEQMERRMKYYDSSARSLKMSLDIDIRNDLFFIYYVKLLLAGGDFEEAFYIIDIFCERNPHTLIGHKIRFETLCRYRTGDDEWIEAGKEYHKIDPLCSPEKVLNPLINHYENIIEQTSKENTMTLVKAHYNIVELLFQRVEHGNDEIYYLKKLLIHFVWLEFFDQKRRIINTLLETRTGWFQSFALNQNHKTRDHAGLYLLLNELFRSSSHEKEAGDAEKFKERVLKVESLGHGNQTAKHGIDFLENRFPDQSDNEAASENSSSHCELLNTKKKESDLDDLFADAISRILGENFSLSDNLSRWNELLLCVAKLFKIEVNKSTIYGK